MCLKCECGHSRQRYAYKFKVEPYQWRCPFLLFFKKKKRNKSKRIIIRNVLSLSQLKDLFHNSKCSNLPMMFIMHVAYNFLEDHISNESNLCKINTNILFMNLASHFVYLKHIWLINWPPYLKQSQLTMVKIRTISLFLS